MTIRFVPEPAPDEYSAEWIERQLRALTIVLARSLDLEPSAQVTRPREGMVRYYDTTVYDPGSGTGLYVYTGGAWVKL